MTIMLKPKFFFKILWYNLLFLLYFLQFLWKLKTNIREIIDKIKKNILHKIYQNALKYLPVIVFKTIFIFHLLKNLEN